jgi:glycerophosphoryl diester phosphodiesterase
LNPTRPLIIGHRGASALAPENTLAAFARAMEDGADGVEFDVRLSKDNVPVVIHDAGLRRTGGVSKRVSELTAQQLGKMNVGSCFNRRFPALANKQYDKERVPTLEHLLRQFLGTSAVLYLEMKSDGRNYESLADACVELLHKYSFIKQTIVECFDLNAIAFIKELDPAIRTAALFEPAIKRPLSLLKRRPLIKQARDARADELALHHRLVNRRMVGRARESELPCVIWTVDHPRWTKRASDLGLKAVITNNPEVMTKSG